MPTRTLVIRLETMLVREVLDFVAKPSSGYASISDFAEVALLNQLELENVGQIEDTATAGPSDLTSRGDFALLRLPVAARPTHLASVNVPEEPLGWLTNRLSPLKISVRVLANLASGGWPKVAAFQRQVGAIAEALGRLLREEDQNVQRRGYSRRWIGFPVRVEDAEKSRLRFISSFGISLANERATGPLATLGLVTVEGGHVLLTESGWRLAVAPSPLLGEDAAVGTLSTSEREAFLEILHSNKGEWLSILEFIHLLEETTRIRHVINKLKDSHPGWSEGSASAHRAAMIGRLHDLGWVEVEGRGEDAVAHLTALVAAAPSPTQSRRQ